MCFAPQRRALFRHLNFQKWSEPVSFCTFDFEMCFARQRRALFRHRNFEKCSRMWGIFSFFSCKCASRHNGVHFFIISTSRKVLRSCGVLYILTWKRASRHNSAHFFISHLASWLRTRRFSEPTFRPSGATTCFATFLPFRARGSSFFWDFLFLIFFLLLFLSSPLSPLLSSPLLFSSLLFSSLLFFDSYHLCFSICPYCRKFDF